LFLLFAFCFLFFFVFLFTFCLRLDVTLFVYELLRQNGTEVSEASIIRFCRRYVTELNAKVFNQNLPIRSAHLRNLNHCRHPNHHSAIYAGRFEARSQLFHRASPGVSAGAEIAS
jgi:hypothetical protein